jgi:hypothetical protein
MSYGATAGATRSNGATIAKCLISLKTEQARSAGATMSNPLKNNKPEITEQPLPLRGNPGAALPAAQGRGFADTIAAQLARIAATPPRTFDERTTR